MDELIIGKNRLSVGLSWANLKGDKPSSEFSLLSSETSKEFGVLRKITNNESVSYQAVLSEDPNAKGTIPAAAILADGFEDMIYVSNLPNAKYWVCAIYNKDVLVFGDQVVDAENLISTIKEVFDEFVSNDIALSVVYSKKVAEIVEGESCPEPDETLDFYQLLEQASIKNISKEYKHLKISKVKTNSRVVVLGVVSLAILSVFAYKKFESKQDTSAKLDINPVVEEIISEPPESRMTDNDILSEAKKEEIKWFLNNMNSNDPPSVVKRILAFSTLQEDNLGGWKASEILFDSQDPELLTVIWERTIAGTPILLRKELKNAKEIKFYTSGEFAESKFEVIDKVNNGLGSDFDISSYINNSKYKFESLMHDLIMMNYSYSMKNLDEGPRFEIIKGLQNRTKEKQRQLVNQGKEVEINGSSKDELAAIINILKVAKTFKLTNIKIDLKKNFDWKIQGVLYEGQK